MDPLRSAAFDDDLPTAGLDEPARAPNFVQGQVLYGYTLDTELGRGAQGVVFRAHDSLGQVVALKILSSSGLEERERFLREAQMMHALDCPGIVRVRAAFVEAALPCLVLDYVEGVSLADVFADPAVDLEQKLELLEQVGRAIHCAHEQGIVHRDLKTSNVLVRDGVAKVTDFGIARDLGRATRITETGTALGTPACMAPEQAVGENVGRAADIYALGVMLYQALTGGLPFHGSVAVLLRAIATKTPERPSNRNPRIGREHDRVCLRALAKDPAARHPTALDLARDIERLRLGEPQGRLGSVSPKILILPCLVLVVALMAWALRGVGRPLPTSAGSGPQPGPSRSPSAASTPSPSTTPSTNAAPPPSPRLLALNDVPRLTPERLRLGTWVTVERGNKWCPAVVVGDEVAGYDLLFLDGQLARRQLRGGFLPDVFAPGTECHAAPKKRPVVRGVVVERRRQAVRVESGGELIWLSLHQVWIAPGQRVCLPDATQRHRVTRLVSAFYKRTRSSYPAVELERDAGRSRILYIIDGEVDWQKADRVGPLPSVGSRVVFEPYGTEERVQAAVVGRLGDVYRLRLGSGRELWVSPAQVRVRH